MRNVSLYDQNFKNDATVVRSRSFLVAVASLTFKKIKRLKCKF